MKTPAPIWAAGLRAMWVAPPCGAWARQAGRPCRNRAMPNGRCRLHGGKNPGAPHGNTNALIHGKYSARTTALRKKANALMAQAIHAQFDVDRKLRRGLLRREEAEKQREAIKAKIADAFAMRREAIVWPDRSNSRRED
jgi:hypothetical protein